ncbi:FecR family protein [Anseongella ginsenosidimutans]|uniref:FecR family protein n=1 Tax=Anseongella ginsenosidimutans TaxID=496056 RepID=A0A4R3KUX6_9SPHI|nr:FecR domain-containing protein [Anseongella ginsenosidimutans]QEC51865.1 DUF4974 domain-containing protein [Anseongella ginsenosidimutans]TCS89247.1 FecR family protein [Anseongella ginsenosidimutans]
MEKDRIETLLDKYRRGDIKEEERAFLENWYVEYREYGHDAYDAGELLEDSAAVKSRLQGSVLPIKQRKRFLYAAAATAGLVLISGLYLYREGLDPDQFMHREAAGLSSAAGISPGGNKATLAFLAGTPGSGGNDAVGLIHLSSEKEGIVTDGGKLLYSDGTAIEGRSQQDGGDSRYAVLSTPRGGQYQVRLPDGSRVWLNASSTLTYPLSFEGLKERRISLSGEAYFEVAKDAAKPFLVSTQGQTVEVLGTRFNISSYSAEPVVKTTLLEGSLKVTPVREDAGDKDAREKDAGRLLAPGQQSAILEGSVTVKQVDADEVVAWKNGYFQFNNKNLETALVELARWYDVEIEYGNEKIRKQELAGTISRYATISEVLEKMELAGLMHFRVEGRKIIVE